MAFPGHLPGNARFRGALYLYTKDLYRQAGCAILKADLTLTPRSSEIPEACGFPGTRRGRTTTPLPEGEPS